MTTAAILGLDTALGAYLARLLDARGYAIRGVGDPALLQQLTAPRDLFVAGSAAGAMDGVVEVYDLRGDPDLPELPDVRIAVVIDPADKGRRADLAARRAAGQFVATACLHPHESRLGPGTSAVASIVRATADGVAPRPADLTTTTDCGWTAEYVDALWRLLQLPRPIEVSVMTGVALAGSDVARIADAYFRRQPLAPGIAPPRTATADVAALGWRAVTVGSDLVKVLCDGMTAA